MSKHHNRIVYALTSPLLLCSSTAFAHHGGVHSSAEWSALAIVAAGLVGATIAAKITERRQAVAHATTENQ